MKFIIIISLILGLYVYPVILSPHIILLIPKSTLPDIPVHSRFVKNMECEDCHISYSHPDKNIICTYCHQSAKNPIIPPKVIMTDHKTVRCYKCHGII